MLIRGIFLSDNQDGQDMQTVETGSLTLLGVWVGEQSSPALLRGSSNKSGALT